MSKSTIEQLAEFGQSAWLDYISRSLLESDKFKNLMDQGLRGMTSNPSIFQNAIGDSSEYDHEIVQLKQSGKSSFEIYDALSIEDIQRAADQFKGVYEVTNKLDGYVSLEINPLLANKVDEQIAEGKRLFEKVDRKNVMIKVPSTEEGFEVIEELIASGINVNVTLIFSLEQYIKTVEAYLKGLERLSQTDFDLNDIRSVASVFVSRVDSTVDKLLDDKIAKTTEETKKTELSCLKGKTAVSNSRIIFEKYKELFNSDRFKELAAKGAQVQRVLWGSTSTKNPAYSDVKYVTELIAQPTVNTIPEKTLIAFLDHGEVKDAFTWDADKAFETIEALKKNGIDCDEVCSKLLNDGCVAFNQAFESLLDSIEKKAAQLV